MQQQGIDPAEESLARAALGEAPGDPDDREQVGQRRAGSIPVERTSRMNRVGKPGRSRVMRSKASSKRAEGLPRVAGASALDRLEPSRAIEAKADSRIAT